MTGESIDNFVVRLKRLSQECECQAVSAERYRLELMRDAFLTGIQSHVGIQYVPFYPGQSRFKRICPGVPVS